MLIIYRILSILFFPIIFLYIIIRAVKGKEDKSRIKERFGISSIARLNEDIIWVHAVSVGEVNSILILVEEMLKVSNKIRILFTTTTITSASVLSDKIKNHNGRIIHQFFPIDSYFCVKNFLNYWRPKAVLFVESEIWINFLSYTKKMNIPTFLVNARISQKSFLRWKFARKFGVNPLDYFSCIFVQGEEYKKNLSLISNSKILFFGNLKSQARTLNFNEIELKKLQQQIGTRNFWLAASTHHGEEEIIIATHKKLRQDFTDLLTIIVPRHPNRAEEVKNLMKAENINFSQRSQNQAIIAETEIYLSDSLGELGLFYKLSDFAFIAGSLANVGGHNPFEAIKLDCAVIAGRNVFNFKDIYEKLDQTKSCIMINNIDELCDSVKRFLQNKDLIKPYLQNANLAIKGNDKMVSNIISEIGF